MELMRRVYTSERTTVSGGRDRTARKRKCETRQKQNKSKDKRTGLKTRHYNGHYNGHDNGRYDGCHGAAQRVPRTERSIQSIV